jgi:hypothetical protein
LPGGGRVPVEEDLGDRGVDHGLAAAEPVHGALRLLQVAGLSRHQRGHQPDRLGAGLADGGDLGEQLAGRAVPGVGEDGDRAKPLVGDLTLGPGVQALPRRVLKTEDGVGVRLAQRPHRVAAPGELLPAHRGQAAYPAGPARRRDPLYSATSHRRAPLPVLVARMTGGSEVVAIP